MTQQNPRPFLKWVGGKGQLIPQMERFFPLEFNDYYEPFVGAGAVFFWLYRNKKLKDQIILNDKNSELINCYRVIKDDPEALISDLKKHKYEKEYYMDIRNADRNLERFDKWTDIKKASRTIYLNKTCFNGLYRLNKKGQFNVPMGKYKNPTICDEDNLRAIHKALENVTIVCGDFQDCLKDVEVDDFVYFDPPYHPLSATARFTSYTRDKFTKKDQRRVYGSFRYLSKRECYALLSNSYCDFVLDLYKKFYIETIMAKRSINRDADKRGKIREILVMNKKIRDIMRKEKILNTMDVLNFFKKVGRVTVRKKSNRI